MNQPAGLFSRASLRRLLMFAVGTCVVPWGAATVGCGPSQPAADLKAPTNQEILPTAQCVGGHPSTTPDLMAWDSESRLNLSRLRNSGIVAVRYQAHGCDVQMELLSNCIAHGSYEFTPYVSKERKNRARRVRTLRATPARRGEPHRQGCRQSKRAHGLFARRRARARARRDVQAV
jgi:hypothetical protein